jgi:UDP-GlcNAc:undecaprenyl-phosphate GlcNAc-1-phosphate transferase
MISIPQNYTKYLFISLVGFLATYLLVPVVMALAKRAGMVDRPDERRIHTGVIPRGGGLAVFIGFHLACVAIYFLPWFPFDITLTLRWWMKFMPASLFLVVVGVADDRWGLKPRVKLGCQMLAALALYFSGIHLGGLFHNPLPWPVDCFLTVFWCVGFMNAFNLIDGLDGLATGLGIIAAFGVAGSLVIRHLPGDSLVLLGLIGACLGFLRYNFNPARVFLGDTGSMFIGFTLATISLSTGSKGTILASMAIPLLAAGVPILDTALAVWRRSIRHLQQNTPGDNHRQGEVFSADTDHLHHRLLRTGSSQRRVAFTLYALNGGLVLVGLCSLAFQSFALVIYLVAFIVAAYIIVRHLAHVELWDSGMAVLKGLQRPPTKAVAVMFYPLADLFILALALMIALFLTHGYHGSFKELWLQHAIVWLPIPFLLLAASGTYSRVWSRARITDYVIIAMVAAAGAMIAAAINATLIHHSLHLMAIEANLFGGLSIIGLIGLRLFPRAVQDCMPFILRHQHINGVVRVPCLIYGAGYSCTLFLRAKANDAARLTTHRVVVGLLDDDANLHGRTVYGCRVLGGIEKLEESVIKLGIREIVITTFLEETVFRKVEQFAAAHGVRLFRWRTDTRSQQFIDLHFSFDRCLREIASKLLATHLGSLDSSIGHCLRLSAQFAQADACYAVLFQPGTTTISQTYRWSAHDAALRQNALADMHKLSFPYLMSQLQQHQLAAMQDIEALPPEAAAEKAFLQSQGVKSAIVVPLSHGAQCIGFMGYYGIHSNVIWEKEAVNLLKLQADILTLTILRLLPPSPPTP